MTLSAKVWVTPAPMAVEPGASVYGPEALDEPLAGAPAPEVVQVAPVMVVLLGNTGESASGPYVPATLPVLLTVTV